MPTSREQGCLPAPVPEQTGRDRLRLLALGIPGLHRRQRHRWGRRRRRGGGGTCGTVNAALGHPATASSIQDDNPAYDPFYSTDGSTITRWASAYSDPQWLEVDLGAVLPVCQVTLLWENAYATGFQTQLSSDNVTWTSAYSTTTGTGGPQTLSLTGSGRHIRMYGTTRASGYGYSLCEFSVYTVGGVTATIPPPPAQPAPGTRCCGAGSVRHSSLFQSLCVGSEVTAWSPSQRNRGVSGSTWCHGHWIDTYLARTCETRASVKGQETARMSPTRKRSWLTKAISLRFDYR